MSTATWVDFKSIKAAVAMRGVLDHYGLTKLKAAGHELRGACPIHGGTSADSFHVNATKQCFQCFVCGAKGNVLDFVAAMEKCSVRDAALKLQDWFSLGGQTPKTADQVQAESDQQLAREKDQGRGELVNPPLSFSGLRNIDHAHAYLKQRGLSEETVQHFGVGYFSGKGVMSGRVVIPIHNGAGELVAYAGRSIDGTEPRYKLPAGFHKSVELFNLHRAIATGERGLIVVEGFFDCMTVHQAGYPFVVALMGCAMSEQQEELLVTAADMVLLLLDGDEAGRKATDELMLRLGRRLWVKAARVPDGKQPDQMSGEELQEVLKK